MQAPSPPRVSPTPAPGPASTAWRPRRWLGGIDERVRERSFWLVQAGVALVTGAHWATEAVIDGHAHGGLLGVLVHLPVVLYVVPVAYAALRYGFEGGLLTGAWAGLLAVPNMVVFHRNGYEWVGELALIALVVGLGAVVALPAERERVHRARAEQATTTAAAVNRRLALLSQVAGLPARTAELHRELCRVLQELLAMLQLSTVAVVARPGPSTHATVEVCCGRSAAIRHVLAHLSEAAWEPYGLMRVTDGVAALPLGAAAEERRILLVAGPRVATLSHADRDLLETVAVQLAAAFEVARLQRQQQERWQLYLRQATRAQEDERRRLARELHDVAIHELVLLRRRLHEPMADPDLPVELSAPLEDVRDGLAGVTEQLRRFCGALRPSVLSHLGLPAALEWLTTELSRRAGVRAGIEVDGEARRLSDDDELALFRIAEEALRNAERHADARSITVRLAFRPTSVRLEIADDGVGFAMPASLEDLARHGHLGLLGMRERAELVGGTLRVDATPGVGSRVIVHLPDTNRPAHHDRDADVIRCGRRPATSC